MNTTLKHQLDRMLTANEAAYARLQTALEKVRHDAGQKNIFLQFALCSRGLPQTSGMQGTGLSVDRYGMMSDWSPFKFARLYFLLQLAELIDEQSFIECINQLFSTADVNELILLVQALNFFPRPQAFIERAREAARSNIVSVFSAIAHKNDYAKRYFDLEGWNQLILKAAFLAVPICSIEGLHERNNSELVTMLKHYVWERQAASRDLPWDIWTCIGWQAESSEDLEYLQHQAKSLDLFSRAAITLSLLENKKYTAQGEVLRKQYCVEISGWDWKSLAQMHTKEINNKT